ncbi:hypothetical protein J2Z69_001780 [Paenibacillus shirakamiensis]|uniref:Uncharacterized protein n=1 Tax=Paenibacillus shirakamiensis TaxID=1265935 RepID=A0ABS4JGA9_9BACL|nr:hypothetical protein [Paenibacillus shirakamiensis]MBP2000749.1 hypothetical protein [Paenibacillus shirakamiensis]
MKPKSRRLFRKYRLKRPLLLPEPLKLALASDTNGDEEAYTVLFERKAEYDKPVYRI